MTIAAVPGTAAEVAKLHCREQQWKTLRERDSANG
jgi:hypothetical protein